MAQKDDSDENHESNTISAVVNALAAEAENHNNRYVSFETIKPLTNHTCYRT